MGVGFSPPAVKAALADVARDLFTDAVVCYGDPGSYVPNTVFSIGDQRFTLTRPVHGTRRSREEEVETEITVTSFFAGGEEAQQLATDEAYGLLFQLDEYFRTAPNETLGGVCRDAWVSEGALVEAKVKAKSGSGISGRLSAVSATVTTVHRRS